MTRLMIVLLLSLMLAQPVLAAGGPAAGLVENNNAFALDLYADLREADDNAGKNLFLSPFSISTALAMTWAGAEGETAQQMRRVLNLGRDDSRVHAEYDALLSHLNGIQKEGQVQLSVANALWGQKNYGFHQKFLQLTQKCYGAGLEQVDFRGNTEGARRVINAWVEEKTEKKISNLIPKGALDQMTRLVLTNAIYFKARWANTFNERATRHKPFTLLDGEKIDVPTMHQTDRFGYRETERAKILEMPYKGHKVAMVVILPNEDAGLPELENNLGELLGGPQKTDAGKLDVKVQIAFDDTPVMQVVDFLQTVTGVKLSLKKADLPPDGAPITLHMKGSLEEVLEAISKKTGLAWKKEGGRVRIGKPRTLKTPPKTAADSPLEGLPYTRVSVAIPKFKLESQFMLGRTLRAMGMTDAFNPQKADFSGMSDREDLYIQAAIHKAYVDVYEKGTEAAAATGIVAGATSAHVGPPKEFHADHPFLFLIRDRKTGSILFMGRVLKPE